MDETSQNITDFEALLKNRSTNKPLTLYASSEHKNNYCNSLQTNKISAKEVLSNVSRQVKAMQNADTIGCNRVGNTLNKYKKGEFLPVNKIPVYKEVPQKRPSKFETQCITDTQLINVVENAEIVDKHRGVTQEFDKTFCDDDNYDKPDESSSKYDTIKDTDRYETNLDTNNDNSDVIKENYDLNSQESKIFQYSESITCAIDTVTCCQDENAIDINVNTSLETQGFNKCVEIFDVSNAERSISPVLNTVKRIATPPLVVDLYTFEKFEDLALPIIEEHQDLKVAKNMINSQILGRELSILDHLNEKVGRNSPVLSKIECITTNINKESEKICTCSSKCVDKDVQSSYNPISEDLILNSGKKITESKLKAEIKDEILFSSDEECEYLHKNVQELPLTCALETSFYDKSDVLDKTMYVGFQTASNKSIQINTDSFTKAKSLLGDIDNELCRTSLSDLVEIFDSCKAVSENKELKLTNQTSSKIDHDNNGLIAPSKSNDFKNTVEDTFENVSLTASEQDEEIKDDIVMSQVIPFKSISRTPRLNNSMNDRTISHTVDMPTLEPDKDIDDDVIISQVIQFKSISRTPTNHNACTANVTQECLHSNKAFAKRKFEGFKTASNKKIKLSDKALTRCKKVFQDIDLGEDFVSSGGDSNIKSNNVETEEDFLDDLKLPDFDISDDGLKMNTYTNITNSTCINPIHENVSNIPFLKTDSKVKVGAKDEQPRTEDVDLQINDQNILQEFEENEMPFEETNNNAYVGFKTASNKYIFISDDAMAATKNVFQDIITNTTAINSDTTVKTSENPIDDCDINGHAFKKPMDIKKLTRQSKSPIDASGNQKPFSMPHDENVVCKTDAVQKTWLNGFIGFKTASNKDINISDQAKERTKEFFKDFDEDVIKNVDNNAKCRSSNEEKRNHNLGDDFNCGIDTQAFLSEELTNIEHLFKDNILENKKSKATEIPLDISKKVTYSSDIRIEAPVFVGFQTASAKPINISANAMEKTKKLLSEFELEGDEMYHKEYGQTLEPKPSAFVGFQTASNKKITISAESLVKSNQVLNIFEIKGNCNNKTDGHGINITDTSFDRTAIKDVQQGKDKTVNPPKDLISKFCDFQTASNKEVKISKEALATCKQTFQDVDLFNKERDIFDEYYPRHEEKSSSVFKGFQTANKTVHISENALKSSKGLCRDMDTNDTAKKIEDAPVFKGFQTASNKTVQISETALAKSKGLFKDMNLSQLDRDAKTTDDIPENNFVGFQTTNNKRVKISKEALTPTKGIFRDINLVKENDTPIFKGFQTASNKKVQISESALAKSKRLFEDMNLSQPDRDPKIVVQKDEGFQLSKRVAVAQALAKTKDIYLEDNDNLTTDNTPAFKGFQTASNKKVEVSETALAKSKKLFEDINLSRLNDDPKMTAHKDSFRGFQTENNTDVTISADALAKTKDIFVNLVKGNNNDTTTSGNHINAPVFQGFQTASNKNVAISENALAKCKQMFEDINFSQFDKDMKTTVDPNEAQSDLVNNKDEQVNIHKKDINNIQTPDIKAVKVFGQALEKSKYRFKDIHKQNEKYKDKEIRTPETKIYLSNITNDIDTQVLNDFQETLNTEDFSKTTPTSKRSGSPILSCPRAKIRKFETPYRINTKVEPKNPFIPPKLAKTYNFNENYKKTRKYTLKHIEELKKDHTKTNIDPCITQFSFDNLLKFEFKEQRSDYTAVKMTIEDLKKIFLGSVNKKIVPDGWLDNHIKLIIWKLLSYEVKYPNAMENTCTVKNVLEQLKYRYDRELYHVQRPILRKILEKDEIASKTMVLCVAGIYVDNISVTSVNPSSQNVELLLTDGWYCVRACLDRMLVSLATTGAIVVGTKLAVCGAELMNCEQGIAPWEDTSSVRLKLHGNSVRRARWHARLGVCTDVIRCPLGGARSDGGKIAATRVVVTRVYPPLYVEKMEDGSTVTLSARLEQIRQMKYESERQVVMEKLYEEVEKEMSDQDSQDSEGYSNEKGCLDSGSQISRNMKKSKDPDEYRSHLTKSQNHLLEDHNARQREKLIERVRGKFQEKLDKNGFQDRNVIPLLKVRVAGLTEKDGNIDVTKGYLSIWKPSAAVLELVTEGSWIEILNVIPTGIRNSDIQLSAGRQTVFNAYKPTSDKFRLQTSTLLRKCYEIKEIAQNPAMITDNNEIDTVGMIFCIEPSTKDFKEQSFQNVYLADADKNIICVNFWGGLKKIGFENILDTGQIITCVNLQKRAGNTRKSIPQYRVTELSYFTKTPKNKKALEITNELTGKLSKIRDKFCEDCFAIKNNYSIFKTRDENVSPYRFDYNVSTNIISPLRNCDTNLNLTGLDFESSFNSQEISPQMLLRKKRVNEKIEKIRFVYGEPPPLSSIHIINKSKNASATYKSPLISNLERSKMESPVQNVASPLTANRTFVKNVNPVKLNFSRENLDESVDYFAEDFDASPPLSLDSDILC